MKIEIVFSNLYSLNNNKKIMSPEAARKELFKRLEKYDFEVVRKNSTWKRITLCKKIYYTAVFIFFESKAFNLLNGGSCDFTLNNIFAATASDFMDLLLKDTHISNAIEFLVAVGEKLEEIELYEMAAEFKLGVKSAKKFFNA